MRSEKSFTSQSERGILGNQNWTAHLLEGYASRDERDQVPSLKDHHWIPGLVFDCPHSHCSLENVEIGSDRLNGTHNRANKHRFNFTGSALKPIQTTYKMFQQTERYVGHGPNGSW